MSPSKYNINVTSLFYNLLKIPVGKYSEKNKFENTHVFLFYVNNKQRNDQLIEGGSTLNL